MGVGCCVVMTLMWNVVGQQNVCFNIEEVLLRLGDWNGYLSFLPNLKHESLAVSDDPCGT